VRSKFSSFVEKIPLFHVSSNPLVARPPSWQAKEYVSKIYPPVTGVPCHLNRWYFPFTEFSSILDLAVTKRKPARFSAAKAVKANARELVGQPKPARVLNDKPRIGRQAKHKPKLQDVLQREE
jgi:hypothetical protein